MVSTRSVFREIGCGVYGYDHSRSMKSSAGAWLSAISQFVRNPLAPQRTRRVELSVAEQWPASSTAPPLDCVVLAGFERCGSFEVVREAGLVDAQPWRHVGR
jgi:hypothetical protein